MPKRETKTTDGAQPLIGTKLEYPKPLARLVPLPRLIEMLDRSLDGRVTLISAPAGYGKTTLVGRWLGSDSSPPAAWLSLDRLDNDLERFARYVIAALRRVEEGCFPETGKILSAPNVPPPQYLAELMVLETEKLGQRVVLVLDDYGLIRAPAVHELMSSLVPKLPSTLHLVVVSRIDPPLPLSLWRSRHWLHELRAADLRLTREETGAFFAAANELELSDEGIDTIHRKTEGWITGLRLALLSLTGATDPEERVRAFSASDRLVTDYLMEEVLARQPSEIREFLALTCALERFSAQLCDELLAEFGGGSTARSRELLDRLYKANLFLVPLGPIHGWYRYHRLFRQLLLERFDELTLATPQEDILKRAGDWFSREGWTEDGLKCYLAAGELDAAEDVIGTQMDDLIANDLSRRTLARWLGMFPPGAERNRVPLLVATSFIKTLRSEYEGVESLLEEVDATCSGATGNRQRRWREVLQKDLEFLRAITSFWKGDVKRAYEHTSRILKQNLDPRSFLSAFTIIYHGASLALTGRWAEYRHFVERGTTGPGVSDSPHKLPFLLPKAGVHLYRGELAQCREVASSMTTSTDFAIPKYYEALGYLLLGIVAYERDDLAEAERHFQAVESRRFEAPAFADHGAASGLAQIELARGNIGRAERYAVLARAFALETQSPMLLRGSESLERYLAVAAGKPVDAAASPPPNTDFMHLSINPPSHFWAWVQIQSPSLETRQVALDFVDAALQLAEAHGVTRRVIQLSTLRALALDALNRRDEAIPVLEATLRRGASLGFFRSFVDCGERIRPLLHAVAKQNPDDGHVAMLVDAIGTSYQQSQPQAGSATSIDRLTNRELDVLELLQRRLTNKEIASQLGISATTVKMHTLNIYDKLGVHDRRQAVAVAIERGFLTG